MEQAKFEALLPVIIPQVVGLIVRNEHQDEVSASRSFYESDVYALLEQEDTKLWQLSPMAFFSMYDGERKTGKLLIPEG